ncbi:MAG: AbrB/MazE/SpoVT family DNA-binding domain-containing protein [Desulfobacteraceae bacterium]|nr:AbrB/MazE/SpoVT family DNA-binding domain-containing protein [Desulfobacteraceae bacterium]
MANTIKLTSKRQVTFPVQLCRELGVKAGEELILERKKIEGTTAWIIKPKKHVGTKWFGGLKKYIHGKDHNMESIRSSIGKNLGKRIE